MGNDHQSRESSASVSQAATQSAGAPGRASRSQARYQGQENGLGGPLACEENPNKPNCFLSPGQRMNITVELSRRMSFAFTTFSGVVNNAKIKEDLKPDPNLMGLVIDILYVAGMGALKPVLEGMKTLSHTVKGGLVKVNDVWQATPDYEKVLLRFDKEADAIGALLTNGLSSAKKNLQAHASGVASESAKSEFLSYLQNQAAIDAQDLFAYVSRLDDVKLLAAVSYYDAVNHSVQRYQDEVRRLIDVYENDIEVLGKPIQGAVGGIGGAPLSHAAVLVVGPHGMRQSRMAICLVPAGMTKGSMDDGVVKSFVFFERWVENGFEGTSVRKQKSLGGGSITIRHNHLDSKEVDEWVKESSPQFDPYSGNVMWSDEYE